MRKLAPKYPHLDPTQPRIFERILAAANTMRARQQAESEIGRLMARARMNAKAAAVVELEDDEPVIRVPA